MSDASPANLPLSNSGVAFAVSSYVIWGIAPVYWKLAIAVPSHEVLIPRVLWTTILLLILARATGRQTETWEVDTRRWCWTLVSASLLACNWAVFIYAVQSDQVIATSLGYYINPLVSILLGVIVVGERMNWIQTIAVGLAAIGVASMALNAGQLPWISLALAGCFGCYGLIHKLIPRPAIAGLTREMLILSPIAILALLWLFAHPTDKPGLIDASLETQALLALAGAVTAAPLLLFHASTRRLPLIAVGMFQYIAPTISLLLAVVVYDETFTMSHAVGFGCVWIGLAIFTFDSARRTRPLPRAA